MDEPLDDAQNQKSLYLQLNVTAVSVFVVVVFSF